MVKYIFSIGATCFFLVTGCGVGSDSDDEPSTSVQSNTDTGENLETDDTNTNTLTGVFVDSAVEGASYSTASQSGTTNSEGEFNYLEGEQVVFSIGAIQFPTVAAAPQVSPVDMGAASINPSATTTNIARFLQSLDSDNDPDNGISIPTTATENATTINFDVSVDEFANNADVINLVANSGSVNTSLISAEAANSHLNSTLGITMPAGNNDGIWIRTQASESEFGVPNYSIIDGLNITRYNGELSSDGSECYTASSNSITPLGDNRFQLNAAEGPMFFSMVRVGETLEITFDGEATQVYPPALGVVVASLTLCVVDAGSEVDMQNPMRDIVTIEDFTATIVGKQLVSRNVDGTRNTASQAVIGEDMKVTGFTATGSLDIDWFWDATAYCRSGVVGLPDNPFTLELECQGVSIDNNIVTFSKNRGNGETTSRWFIE